MLLLWRTFVLSLLDYYTKLLTPGSVKLIAELEAIQRHFTKMIDSIKHIDYWESLKDFGLYTPLPERR